MLWAAKTEPRSWPLNCLSNVEFAVWPTHCVARKLYAHMSTQMRYAYLALGIALLFVQGGRIVITVTWVILWLTVCEVHSVNALENLFGKPNVWCLVISELQWLRAQLNRRKGRGRAKRDCGPWAESMSNLSFVPQHFYWLLSNCNFVLKQIL